MFFNIPSLSGPVDGFTWVLLLFPCRVMVELIFVSLASAVKTSRELAPWVYVFLLHLRRWRFCSAPVFTRLKILPFLFFFSPSVLY